MDYTTLDRVKAAMDATETADDTVLGDFITRASRTIDHLCTAQPAAGENYFAAEDVANEVLTNGAIDYRGNLVVWPHKPFINTISAMAFRYRLSFPWSVVDLTKVSIEQEQVIFEGSLPYAERLYVQISYNGGLGKTTDDLPADFIDLATLMTIRLYKEARSGYGDSIGVAQTGLMVYTKALPIRLEDELNSGYARLARW